MEIRYSANPADFKHYTTDEIRREFLVETLFLPDRVTSVYSHVDRMVVLGAMPVSRELNLEAGMDCWKEFGVHFFLERRELGMINIGGPGEVEAGGKRYEVGHLCGLYLPMGTRKILLKPLGGGDAPAPKFYLCSAPAHAAYPAALIPYEKAIHRDLGSAGCSNERTINQFLHPDVLKTCQLCMGCTVLKPGSVWNTMPVHTHERRMEVYLYFHLPKDNVVFHLMGEGRETRHIVVQNEQAVINPSWSIHAGCGTSDYAFIWAMAGENIAFDDMDGIPTAELR